MRADPHAGADGHLLAYYRWVPGVSGLFIRDGQEIFPLVEQPYDAENVLQALLANHPELLPGEALDPDEPRRFLLIEREVAVAGLRLDHLFLDQDAVPTLVETKRGINREGRREVVAQMLDYAANAAVEWDASMLEGLLRTRCAREVLDLEAALIEFEYSAESNEAFFQRAEENLRAGRVRLIFVSDEIPPSLQRIVEFLNERMTPTEVFACEIRQYLSEGKQILQASIVGQTEKAREIKGVRKLQPPVLPALLDAGVLKDGDDLWVVPERIRSDLRPADAADPVLRFTLVALGLNVRYEADGAVEEMKASLAPSRVRRQLGQTTNLGTAAVAENLSKEPGGPSLADIARELGIWA